MQRSLIRLKYLLIIFIIFLFGYYVLNSKGSIYLGDMTYIGITIFGSYFFIYFK